MSEYNPLTGENWDRDAAGAAWYASMNRSGPRWQLQGGPGAWHWSFFNFRPYRGIVTIDADGFHWRTVHYDTGAELHSGVTTSLYEAYQSVEQNRPVIRAMTDAELRAHLTASHPGIRQANALHPAGRSANDLESAHDMQHGMFPDGQDHAHEGQAAR